MNKQTNYWVGGVIVIIVASISFLYYQMNRNEVSNSTISNNAKDTSYTIEGQSVKLVNGISIVPVVSDSTTNITTKYFGNEAMGDLNGDGLSDTAFILTQSLGGSGTFYYVVVALNTTNGYVGTNGVLLGDRIAPQTTEIKNGQVIVNYADRKAGEAMTVAPSIGVSKYLKLSGNQLVEIVQSK